MFRCLFTVMLLSLMISTLYAQFPNGNTGDFSSGRVNTLNTDNSALDSLERPALKIIRKNLLDRKVLITLDTNYINPHIVEPFLRNTFYSLNLGSENSASQAVPITYYNDIGLELGQDQYRPLTDQYNPYDYIDVNRSYWGVHYGKGGTINSDNLEVNFYRKFARGIILNFDYETHSDNSWRANQSNSSKRMELKLIQESPKRDRKTYFFFQNIGIDETHSRTLSTNEDADSRWSNFILEFGNQMILKDSLANNYSLSLYNSLKLGSNHYNFLDNTITSEELESFFPLESSSINLQNHLKSTEIRNRVSLSNSNSDIGAVLNFNSKNNRNGQDTTSIDELIIGLDYSKVISPNLELNSSLVYGLLDIAGEVEADLRVIVRKQPLPVTANISFKRLNPSLFFQRQTNDIDILWDNSFLKSTYVYGSLRTELYGFNIGFDANQVSNGVFLGSQGIPIQIENTVSGLSIRASKKLNYKFISSSHDIIYNRLNNNVLLTPELQLNGNVKTNLFIKRYNANIEVGLDYYFMPSYEVPSFHPVFGKFYNDNTVTNSGNLIILNPYLTIGIDSFLFFIKSNNAGAALSSVTVAPVKDYPLYNYRVVFGIKWRLLD